MSRSGPRQLADLLQSGDISRLKSESRQRHELTEEVRSSLPPAEAGHVVSAHFDDRGRLVVGMDSAAWAARLRYATSELLGRELKVRVTQPVEPGS
jgi:hypothetical protein